MAKKRLIVGNWKMYIESGEAARALAVAIKRRARRLRGAVIWLAPPSVFFPAVAHIVGGSKISAGTQLVSRFEGAEGGASAQHTGEISARMIKSTSGSFALVGHSERRALGESDDAIGRQMLLCAQANITALLCIGERERDEHGGHFDFLAGQLRTALADFPTNATEKLVVAYEPLYAIGKTAEDAIPARDLRETAIFIRKTLAEKFGRVGAGKIPVLYGGSVEGANAKELIELGGVDGFLVGHASTQADSFFEIVRCCEGGSDRVRSKPKIKSKSKSKSKKRRR